MTEIYVCCWCSKALRLPPDCYDFCPHCLGSFSWRKPVLVEIGIGI